LKKNANMEAARTAKQQKLLPPFNAPYESITFPQNGKQKPLLSLPAARGDKS